MQSTATISPATTTKTVPSTIFNVNVIMITPEPFDDKLSISSSIVFQRRAQKIKDEYEPPLRKKFASFRQLIVLRFFRGSIGAEILTQFSSQPIDTDVVPVFKTATPSFNVTSAYVVTSTTTKPPTTTTTTKRPTTTTKPPTTTTKRPTTTTKRPTTTTKRPTTTPVPTRPPPKVTIVAVILIPYSPQFENTQSTEFKKLAATIVQWLEDLYRSMYGNRFSRIIVVAFRRFVRTRMEANMEAEIDVVFNETAPQSLPSNTEIVKALKEAAKNSTFQSNVPLLESSITVIREMKKIPVIFFTNGTFVPELLLEDSYKFQNRSSMIKYWLELFFVLDYQSSFSVLYLTNFSSYSSGVKAVIAPTIKNTMNLNFQSNTTLPNGTQIVNTLLRAANNMSLPFKIFPFSIVVNGTAYSSAEVSSHTSVLTASILVVLSLLVTRFD